MGTEGNEEDPRLVPFRRLLERITRINAGKDSEFEWVFDESFRTQGLALRRVLVGVEHALEFLLGECDRHAEVVDSLDSRLQEQCREKDEIIAQKVALSEIDLTDSRLAAVEILSSFTRRLEAFWDRLRIDIGHTTLAIQRATAIEAEQGRQQLTSSDSAPLADRVKDVVEPTERELIIRALQECQGKKTAVAAHLGISRPTLDAKIAKYDLDPVVRVARTMRHGDPESPHRRGDGEE